ncbi:MerR family transcriptional regulator [Actinomadura litoris]|uniref:MerR family transcriptional regulator n=1 Tax=Actinomadura litoris TaxID=2678616 RepID=UPI001FA6C959|nr:MerR family transcriptional regulator [Actinomadura litoris]
MRIGELSRRTGVHERLLRYYEEQDLLHPQRRPSGYREYCDSDIDTVRRIRSLLAAGLNTATIGTILPCLREDEARLVPTCPDLLADLRRQHARITRSITDLETSLGALEEVIAAAPPEVARRALDG